MRRGNVHPFQYTSVRLSEQIHHNSNAAHEVSACPCSKDIFCDVLKENLPIHIDGVDDEGWTMLALAVHTGAHGLEVVKFLAHHSVLNVPDPVYGLPPVLLSACAQSIEHRAIRHVLQSPFLSFRDLDVKTSSDWERVLMHRKEANVEAVSVTYSLLRASPLRVCRGRGN